MYMEDVWCNNDLKRLIFLYLRKNPHKKCKQCNLVLEWDKTRIKNLYIEYGNILSCYECFRRGWQPYNNTCMIC
jgi:hypothetical protein